MSFHTPFQSILFYYLAYHKWIFTPSFYLIPHHFKAYRLTLITQCHHSFPLPLPSTSSQSAPAAPACPSHKASSRTPSPAPSSSATFPSSDDHRPRDWGVLLRWGIPCLMNNIPPPTSKPACTMGASIPDTTTRIRHWEVNDCPGWGGDRVPRRRIPLQGKRR